ncbi:alpha/beta fold hydrolase [Brevundimonas sp.]|jgi:pimeloyl-ACP methyl ester carboxylesterase|uniref:alpha/beta fold hydrolase n=1 Tax=Brevundimonas sp. TaxID=1871086 RepID=UPI0039196B32
MYHPAVYAVIALVGLVALGVAILVFSNLAEARRAEAAVPPMGEFVNVDGARIHYVDLGEGPPVVMLHGLAGNVRNYTQTVATELSRTHRVIIIDRPGSGHSARPGGTSASVQSQADVVHRVVVELGLQRPVIVGHSLGGSVALAYAARHPDDLAHLVLLAPAATPFQPQPPIDRFKVDSAFRRFALAYTVAIPASKRSGPGTLRIIFSPQTTPQDFGTAGGALLARRPDQIIATFEDMSALNDGLAALASELPAIRTPTTVLFGMKDAILDPPVHLGALRRLPAATVEELPGAGHMLMYADPGAVIAAVRAATSGETPQP